MGKGVDDLGKRLATIRKAAVEAAAEHVKAEDTLATIEDREARRPARSGHNDDLRTRYPALAEGR